MKALLALLLLSIPTLPAWGTTCEPIIDGVAKSVSRIFVEYKTTLKYGTAWQIRPGIYVTAAHTFNDKMVAYDESGNKHMVIYKDPSLDLVITKSTHKKNVSLVLDDGRIKFGEQVWSVGFLGNTSTPSVSTGFVLNTKYFSKRLPNLPLFTYGATGWFGLSGGPVLVCRDGSWRVTGMFILLFGNKHPFSEISIGSHIRSIKSAIESSAILN